MSKVWDADRRANLLASLIQHAEDSEKRLATPARLRDELAEFANDHWPGVANRPPTPDENTTKKWLRREVRKLSSKFIPLVSAYMETDAYEALTIRSDQVERIAELQRFFGTEPSRIEQIGPAIEGNWLMYRRWRKPKDRYIVSPVTFVYYPNERVISSTDVVQLKQAGSHFDDRAERWDGIAVPQGRFTYLIHRALDSHHAHVNNLKFTILDDISPSDQDAPGGIPKLHIMSGYTTIGINMHSGGNTFVTVMERISKERDFPSNPIPFDHIPLHVKDRIEEREDSFIKHYDFS